MKGTWRWPTFLVLTVVWVGLTGDPTIANFVAGALAAALIVILFPLEPPPFMHRLHPLALLQLVGFVAVNLLVSSVQVVRAVLLPTPARLRAGVVRVDLEETSPLVATLVSNAISLTPGTLALVARNQPTVIYVHVLGLEDLDEFRSSILDLQRRVTAAFTPIEVAADARGLP